MVKVYNKNNFFKHTYCIFKEIAESDFPFDVSYPHYKSKSGSLYFYTDVGVYRVANHWGRAANCRWRLEVVGVSERKERLKIGYASWVSFYPDNDNERLYHINVVGDEVLFVHKQEADATGKWLRTASDTKKAISKIKAILKRKEYLEPAEIEAAIHKLIFK